MITKGIILLLAATIQGIAMSVFLFPHMIPSGGAASVGVLFNHLLHVPFAVTLWTLNAGLLFAAIKWLGRSSTGWTLFCVTVTSFTINLISPSIQEPLYNAVIDLVLGSILFGIGVGILFRMGASSGGMDILALIISRLKGWAPGRTLFWINGSLLLFTGVVVDWKIILYSIACQFISTKILDVIYKLSFNTRKDKTYMHV